MGGSPSPPSYPSQAELDRRRKEKEKKEAEAKEAKTRRGRARGGKTTYTDALGLTEEQRSETATKYYLGQ